MTKVLVTQSKLDTLAEVIGGKSNTNVPLTVDEMITAADSITSGGITPTGNINIMSAGVTDVTNYATATVPQGQIDISWAGAYKTVSGTRKWDAYAYAGVDEGDSFGTSGYISSPTIVSQTNTYNAVPTGTTVTPSTSSQTIGGANYMMEGPVTVSAMPSGTAGTPTATKGAVNNHAISVTPSVTNTTGYITGSTKTGTAVSISASELVSGTLPVSTNGQQDVTNYQYVDVNVSGGGGCMTVATATATLVSASSSISFTGLGGEPTSFYVVSVADLATGASPYKTAAVVYDGTDVIGQTITNTNNAQVSYDDTNFSYTYNNGTLTITGATYFQANQYKLVYTYGGSSANIGTDDVQVGSGATSITFTGLSEEPSCFSCIFKSNFSTSTGYTRTIVVVYDGTNTYGMEMGSGALATSNWSYTYNSGSLTISSQSTSAGGYFHQPGYYQLTYGIGGEINIDVEPLNVTQNGVYSESGKAYSPVTVNVSGGSSTVASKTATLSTAGNSISFTQLSGQPIAWFARCTTQLSSSGSTTYYYVDSCRYNGTDTQATLFRIGSTRRIQNQTSGISYTYSGGTLTITTTATAAGSTPGFFYNGTYELTYIY